MKVTNTSEIFDLLLEQISAEDLVKEINKAQRRKEEKDNKKTEATKARKNLTNAFLAYIKTVSPYTLTDKEIKEYEKLVDSEIRYMEDIFFGGR